MTDTLLTDIADGYNKLFDQNEKLRQQLEETQLRAESFEGSFNACEKQLAELEDDEQKAVERCVIAEQKLAECQAQVKAAKLGGMREAARVANFFAEYLTADELDKRVKELEREMK